MCYVITPDTCCSIFSCFYYNFLNVLISESNLQVDDGDSLPVCFPDDAVEILESGRQEGAERSLHSDGLSLCEAQEVSAPDAPHGAGLRGVQGDQVELRE